MVEYGPYNIYRSESKANIQTADKMYCYIAGTFKGCVQKNFFLDFSVHLLLPCEVGLEYSVV